MPAKLRAKSLPPLSKRPLKWALAQVSFRDKPFIDDPIEAEQFHAKLGREEWRLIEEKATQTQPELGPVGEEVCWRFSDPTNSLNILLTKTSLSVQAPSKYQGFKNFMDKLQIAADILVEMFSPEIQSQINLRYVNEINDIALSHPDKLDLFVNQDLAIPRNSAFESNLVVSMNELNFQRKDGAFLLRHGLIQPEKYLLDFEYYSQQPVDFDIKNILGTLQTFHEFIELMFVWSLGDNYYKKLVGNLHA